MTWGGQLWVIFGGQWMFFVRWLKDTSNDLGGACNCQVEIHSPANFELIPTTTRTTEKHRPALDEIAGKNHAENPPFSIDLEFGLLAVTNLPFSTQNIFPQILAYIRSDWSRWMHAVDLFTPNTEETQFMIPLTYFLALCILCDFN